MGMDLLIPGAPVSNTSDRSAKASVVSASLELAAYPDEDDELELLDELLDDELLEDEALDDELLEDELLEDEVPPHPLSTTANAASVKFKDFIFRSKQSLLEAVSKISRAQVGWSPPARRNRSVQVVHEDSEHCRRSR